MAKKKKAKKHLSETGARAGVLSRNCSYRADARSFLSGAVPNYQTATSYGWTLATIIAQDLIHNRPLGNIFKGRTQDERARSYGFNETELTPPFRRNWDNGFMPYPNEAHHVLVCEVFYEKKWDAKHLNEVLKCKYDINEKENIIYLPLGDKGRKYILQYQRLPNHADGHGKYNKRVITQCDEIWDLVDQALAEEDCENVAELRDKIYKTLKGIEQSNFNKLKSAGPVAMS